MKCRLYTWNLTWVTKHLSLPLLFRGDSFTFTPASSSVSQCINFIVIVNLILVAVICKLEILISLRLQLRHLPKIWVECFVSRTHVAILQLLEGEFLYIPWFLHIKNYAGPRWHEALWLNVRVFPKRQSNQVLRREIEEHISHKALLCTVTWHAVWQQKRFKIDNWAMVCDSPVLLFCGNLFRKYVSVKFSDLNSCVEKCLHAQLFQASARAIMFYQVYVFQVLFSGSPLIWVWLSLCITKRGWAPFVCDLYLCLPLCSYILSVHQICLKLLHSE